MNSTNELSENPWHETEREPEMHNGLSERGDYRQKHAREDDKHGKSKRKLGTTND